MPEFHQRVSAKNPPAFSAALHAWLKTGSDKTLAGLSRVFGEKAFAIIFLLLMALPALPLPTGGVTHVTELITMLVSLELITGRKTVWLPKKWLAKDVSKLLSAKAITRLIRVIRWFERFSRQRWSSLLVRSWVLAILGLAVLIFTLAAFLAPPFSGLDTLPALGVVVISLAMILEDFLFVIAAVIIGAAGIAVEIAAGTALYHGIGHFF